MGGPAARSPQRPRRYEMRWILSLAMLLATAAILTGC